MDEPPPEPLDKVPPPQRVSDATVEEMTNVFMQARTDDALIPVSRLLDILMDLRDLRDNAKAPGDSPEERVDWHLWQINALFALVRRAKSDDESA